MCKDFGDHHEPSANDSRKNCLLQALQRRQETGIVRNKRGDDEKGQQLHGDEARFRMITLYDDEGAVYPIGEVVRRFFVLTRGASLS